MVIVEKSRSHKKLQFNFEHLLIMKKLVYAAILMLGLGMMVSCGGNGQGKTENKETTNTEIQEAEPIEEAEPVDTRPRVYACAYDAFVNIRETPEAKAPILGVFRNGPDGAVLLGTEGEWTKIDCNGIVGYVLSKYVQDTPTVAVDEGIDMKWLEGWWENNECQSLLIFDNGGFMEYSCMFNEGSTTKKGSFILQGSSLLLTVVVDFVNWPDNQFQNTITLPLDPIKKTIVGYKKQQLKTKELYDYLEEIGSETYDDLYLTKKEFNNLKKHVFDKFTGY